MTVPHYGRRKANTSAAGVSGDTLYFAFGTYNDSGNNEGALGTFAVTDIEVIKNGVATVRATDSGYSLISDTGQVGDRLGLNRFSIQLFNTNDDATFYAENGWYQVFVDGIDVDGKTVRFWCGSFEVGTPVLDTGQTNNLVWDSLTASHATDSTFGSKFDDMDSGIRDRLDELDTGMRSWVASDTGLRVILALADTGKIATAVWAGDTGLRSRISETDTGIRGFMAWVASDTGVRLVIREVDTGLRDTLADYDTGIRFLLALQDTGKIATAVWAGDTGLRSRISESDTGIRGFMAWVASDTGVRLIIREVDTGLRKTMADYDTGIRDYINDAKNELDTGLSLDATWHDTGTHSDLHAIITALAATDTGKIATAVWAGDTGLRDLISDVKVELDTGLRDFIDSVDTGLRKTLADYDTGIRFILVRQDTGAIATAVWAGDTGLRELISDVDTGLRKTLADYDTGMRDLVADLKVELDTGLRDFIDSVDTGLRKTLADYDTGLRKTLADYDTGQRDMLTDFKNELDTGIKSAISSAGTDTGVIANAAAIRAKTDKMTFDTGNELQVDIRKVNNITVTGSGNSGDEWGPT